MRKKEEMKVAIEKHATIANAQKLVTLKAPKGARYHKEGEEVRVTEKVAEILKLKGYK